MTPSNAPPSPASGTSRRPLGETLIARGLLTKDQLRIALLEQKARGIMLGKALVALGFLTEATLRDCLAENLGYQQIDLSHLVPSSEAMNLVSREFAKRHKLFPVQVDEEQKVLSVALADPNDVVTLDKLNLDLGGRYRITVCVATEGEIGAAIDLHYEHELSIDGILNEIETGEIDLTSLDAYGAQYSGPFVRLIDALLADAVKRRASDLHFEPESGFVRIRYRIDGVLRQIRAIHAKFWAPMVVRLKVIAGMNIAESRAPQDGRITLNVNGRQIDFRAATQPIIHGENMVLRIIDSHVGMVPLEQMDLHPEQLETIEAMMVRPEGMILVTGPTGSGKTSTLYSMLSRLNTERVNIMTLEDPVEYPLAMIRQTNLAANAKLDFASGIRSLMRQDPDIILVGEVRDHETASQTLRAAMTGHLVFSTLHTNSALGSIARLHDLGLTPELIAGNLIGVIGQRLVRRLCSECKTPTELAPETAQVLGIDANQPRVIYQSEGCTRCDYQGFRGRLAILEVLHFNDELDELLVRRASQRELLHVARKHGFQTLAEDALRRVLAGQTSLDEAARVVDLNSLAGRAQDFKPS